MSSINIGYYLKLAYLVLLGARSASGVWQHDALSPRWTPLPPCNTVGTQTLRPILIQQLRITNDGWEGPPRHVPTSIVTFVMSGAVAW